MCTGCRDIEITSETAFKGGYLDFSRLIELKNMYITEIYMQKQCKSPIIKNHKITKNIFFDGVPLRLLLDFAPEKKKKALREYPLTNDVFP